MKETFQMEYRVLIVDDCPLQWGRVHGNSAQVDVARNGEEGFTLIKHFMDTLPVTEPDPLPQPPATQPKQARGHQLEFPWSSVNWSRVNRLALQLRTERKLPSRNGSQQEQQEWSTYLQTS